MYILLKTCIEIAPHFVSDISSHGEELIRGEAAGGVTNRIYGHPQEDVFHFISILCVDFIDLLLDNLVLKGNLQFKSQAVLGAATNGRKSGLSTILGELHILHF